ncbi:hypothetical protein HDU67_000808 [Dinochytrium kinnereticum]|nr:hypothetical protein HDU67_000808 [Dinochytrium kinnereticum]
MHLMYTLNEQGKRVYTLKKQTSDGKITKSAHPASLTPRTVQGFVGNAFRQPQFPHARLFSQTPEPRSPPKPTTGEDLDNTSAHAILEKLMVHDGTTTTTSEYPNPIFDSAKLKLKYYTSYNLSRLGNKFINLTCPHPGSISYMQDIVRGIGTDIGANVIALDYLSMVELVDKASSLTEAEKSGASSLVRSGGKGRSRGSSLSVSDERHGLPPLNLSPSFSPAHFIPWADRMADPHDDALEDDDDIDEMDEFDEEDDVEDSSDSRRRNSGTFNGPHPYEPKSPSRQNPINLKLVISPNIMSGRSSRHDKDNSGVSVRLDTEDDMSHHGVSSDSSIDSGPPTFYNTDLRSSDLSAAGGLLVDFILHKARENSEAGKGTKFIVFFKDTTDAIESSSSGRRVIMTLMKALQRIREEHSIPVILVAGCSPGLLPLPSAKVDTTPDFYRRLFADKVVTVDKGEGSRMMLLAYEGVLYKTCLDSMKSQFEKVEIPPPTPQLLSTVSSESGDAALKEAYDKWLHSMRDSLNLRFRELNWRSICKVCHDRNVVIRGLDLEDILNPLEVDRTRMPEKLPALLESLQKRIFTTEEVVRLVSLALGYRFDLLKHTANTSISSQIGLGDPPLVDISALHLEMALRLYDDDSTRKLGEPYTSLLKDEFGNAIGTADSKSGKGGGDDGSGGMTESEAPPIDGSTTSTQTINTSTSSSPTTSTTSTTSSSASSTSTPISKSPEEALAKLKKEFQKLGHKLSTYESKLLSAVVSPANIKVNFQDIVLPAPTKLMLQTIVTLPLLRPEMFSSGILSKYNVSGVLLFGPPGTGKTMLAKAIAKSCRARFLSIAPSDVFDKYVGEGEKNVKAIFSLARKLSPCVVFLDEVDAIFSSRRGDINNSRREIVNEFMSEWDGLSSQNNGVIIMGATNRPFDLDDAILRRMPRRVLVDLPNDEQRTKILSKLLEDETLGTDVSLEELSKKTLNYSGSDLKNLTVSTALAAVKECLVRENLERREPSAASLTTEEVLKEADTIEDWSDVLGGETPEGKSDQAPRRTLNKSHFDLGLKEVPPSLTDEMQSLVELRKWNDLYGEGSLRSRAAAKRGWGFNFDAKEAEKL